VTGAGIKAEHKVLMEIEYLKQLQIKYNTQLDLFAIQETYVDTTIKTRANTATVQGLRTSTKATYDTINGNSVDAYKTLGNFATVVPSYTKALNDLKLIRSMEKVAQANYKDYEKRVLVDKREMDNQKYLADELLAEWNTWTKKLGAAAVTVGTPKAATGLYLAKATAAADKTAKADAYDKVSPKGKKQLAAEAKTEWEKKVKLAVASASAVDTELKAVMASRKTAEEKAVAYATAVVNYNGAMAKQTAKTKEIAGFKKEKLAAIIKCQGLEYDKFDKGLKKRIQARATKLSDIETLLDKAITDAPKKGKKGWRCEKALSNGTFRPKRNEKTCDATLCCGAGKYRKDNLVITVETCQAAADKTYNYQPPRAPLATSAPKVISVPFACITGANKLAAAASALAAAVYMMA